MTETELASWDFDFKFVATTTNQRPATIKLWTNSQNLIFNLFVVKSFRKLSKTFRLNDSIRFNLSYFWHFISQALTKDSLQCPWSSNQFKLFLILQNFFSKLCQVELCSVSSNLTYLIVLSLDSCQPESANLRVMSEINFFLINHFVSTIKEQKF